MKKMNNFGRALSRKEQKLILGGAGASVACSNGMILSVSCPSGHNAIGNEQNDSVKCCSTTVDCCTGIRCDGSTFSVGSGCSLLPIVLLDETASVRGK